MTDPRDTDALNKDTLPDCDKDGNPNLYSSQDVINQLMTSNAEQYTRILRLRHALVECGRLVGGVMQGTVSDSFLCMIPDEVRAFVSKHSTCWPGSSHPVVTELIDALRDSTDHIAHVTAPTRDEDIAVIDRARAAIAKAGEKP